ncbi:hypothetical protein SDC9_147825 [bioreactor metagenome]|uniref:Uncharacterized protein n=1 Tax=bioreactor metagenome TaxID=1076179 RepID=A0A645EHK3_9ZZZZ
MSLYGLFADKQLVGNFLVVLALTNQTKYIQLSFCQFGEQVLLITLLAAELLYQACCHSRVKHSLPLYRFTDHLSQIIGVNIF